MSTPQRGDGSRWADTLAVLAALLAGGGLYLLTLAPTVTSEDSGELIAAAYYFGIPHPPGYPVWTLLCGVFLRVCPFGEIAYRANLFSAVCSALSVVPLFATLRLVGIRRAPAFAATLTWICSGTLWAQSVVTEVYGLNALCCSVLLWLAAKWHVGRSPVWPAAMGFVAAVGFGNHHTILFTVLGIAMWIGVWARPRRGQLVPCALLSVTAALIGLLPYLYLPVRARAQTPMNWGNPAGWEAFWKHVTRAQYGATAPLEPSASRSVARFARQTAYVGGVVADDLTPPLALASLLGLALMAYRRSSWAGLVVCMLLTSGFLFLLIANIDLDRTFRFAMKVFFIPLALAAAIPLGFILDEGLERLASILKKPGRLLGTIVVLSVPALPATANFERCNYSDYWYAHDHALNMLVSMRPDAVVFPSGDHNTFPLIYAVLVEDRAPSVIIADKYGYTDPALLEALSAERRYSMTEPERQAWLIRRARRPAYFTVKSAPVVDRAALVPLGVVYHLLPQGFAIDQDDPWTKIDYRNLQAPSAQDLGAAHVLGDYFFFRGLNHLRRGDRTLALADFAASAEHLWGIKESFNNIGGALAEHGLTAEAQGYFEKAAALDPRYLTPRRNLVHLHREAGRWVQVERLLQELCTLAPQDPWPLNQLASLYAEVHNDPAKARQYWKRSLRLAPGQPRVRESLGLNK